MNITIDMKPIQDRFDAIDTQLELIYEKLAGMDAGVPFAADPQKTPARPIEAETQATAPAEVQPAPEVKNAAPEYTISDIQKRVTQLAATSKETKAAVRDIVKAYAEKVTDIPEDKFADVMDKLSKLGW